MKQYYDLFAGPHTAEHLSSSHMHHTTNCCQTILIKIKWNVI